MMALCMPKEVLMTTPPGDISSAQRIGLEVGGLRLLQLSWQEVLGHPRLGVRLSCVDVVGHEHIGQSKVHHEEVG